MAPPLKPPPFNLEGPDPVITSTLTLATDHLTRTLIWLSASLQQQQEQLEALASRVEGLEGGGPGLAHDGRHGKDGEQAGVAAGVSSSASGTAADPSRSSGGSRTSAGGGGSGGASGSSSGSPGKGDASEVPQTVEQQLKDLSRRLSESDDRVRQELDSLPDRVRDQVRSEVAPRLGALEAQSQGWPQGHPSREATGGAVAPAGEFLGGAGSGTAGAGSQGAAAPGSAGTGGHSAGAAFQGDPALAGLGPAANSLVGHGAPGVAGVAVAGHGGAGLDGGAAGPGGTAGRPSGAGIGPSGGGAAPGSAGAALGVADGGLGSAGAGPGGAPGTLGSAADGLGGAAGVAAGQLIGDGLASGGLGAAGAAGAAGAGHAAALPGGFAGPGANAGSGGSTAAAGQAASDGPAHGGMGAAGGAGAADTAALAAGLAGPGTAAWPGGSTAAEGQAFGDGSAYGGVGADGAAGAGGTAALAAGFTGPGSAGTGVLGTGGTAAHLGSANPAAGLDHRMAQGQGGSSAAGGGGGGPGAHGLVASAAGSHGVSAGLEGTRASDHGLAGSAGVGTAAGVGHGRGSSPSIGQEGTAGQAADAADLRALCRGLQTELHSLRGDVDRLKDTPQPATIGDSRPTGDLTGWRSEIDREVLRGRSGKLQEGDDGPASLAGLEKRLENQLMQKLSQIEARLSQDMIARMQGVPSASATARRAGSKRPGTQQSSPPGQTPGASRANSAGDSRSAAESLEGTSLWDEALGAFEGRRRPGGGPEAGFNTGPSGAGGVAGGGLGGRAGAGPAGGRAGAGPGGRDPNQHGAGAFGDGGSGGFGWAAGGAAGGVAAEEGGTGSSGGVDNMGSLLQRVGHLEACLRGLESVVPNLQSLSTYTGPSRHDQSLSDLSGGGSITEGGSPGHPGAHVGAGGAAGHWGQQPGAANLAFGHGGQSGAAAGRGNGARGGAGDAGAPSAVRAASGDPDALITPYQAHGGGPWGPAGRDTGTAGPGASLAGHAQNPGQAAKDPSLDAGGEWATLAAAEAAFAAGGQSAAGTGRSGAGAVVAGQAGRRVGAQAGPQSGSRTGTAAVSGSGPGLAAAPPGPGPAPGGEGAVTAVTDGGNLGGPIGPIGPIGPTGQDEAGEISEAGSTASGHSSATGRHTSRPFRPRQGHGQGQGSGQAVADSSGAPGNAGPEAGGPAGVGVEVSSTQELSGGGSVHVPAPAPEGGHPGLFAMTTTGTEMQQATQKPGQNGPGGPAGTVIQGAASGPGYTVHLGTKAQTPPNHGPQLQDLTDRMGDVEKRLDATEARTRGAHWSTVQAELERFRKLFEFIEGVLPKDTAKAMKFFTEESRAPAKAEEITGAGAGAKNGKKPSKEPWQNILAEFDFDVHKERLQQQVDSHAADMRRELENLMTAIKALQRDFENNRGKMDDFLRRLAGMEYEARQQQRRAGSALSSVASQQGDADHRASTADHTERLATADERSPGFSTETKPSSSGKASGGELHTRADMAQQMEGEGADQLPAYVSQKNMQSALEDLREDMKNWLDVLHGSMISALQQKADTENLKDIVQKVTNASAVANDSIALFAKRSLVGRCASCETPFCADPSMIKKTPPLSLERPWPARSSPGAEVMRARQDVRQLEGKSYTSLKDGNRLPKIQDKASRDLPRSKVQKNASQPELRSMRQDGHPPE